MSRAYSSKAVVVALLLVSVVLSGCQPPESAITVAVYPSRQQCGIDEQMMKCDDIATYLRDTLKLKPARLIYVSAVSSDPLPKDDPSLQRIADTIKALGYTDVRPVNFDLK